MEHGLRLLTIQTAGSLSGDGLLNVSTIEPPNRLTAPLTSRSGEMAPSNTHSVGLTTIPDWNRLSVAGSSSNQRIADPAPAATV